MTAVWILVVIFSFIIIVTLVEQREKTKRTKMKLEAMLREDEMRAGYAPGTYSYVRGRSCDGEEAAQKGMSREELQKGIRDLEERLKNLDTIMKNRKHKEE